MSFADQGVRYPGERRHSANAIRSVMNRPSYRHKGRVPPIAAWERLLGEIRAANEPRVMISSEFLAGAEPETVKRIVADLDPQRIHVVATLRPLASLLPSQWQQDVRRGTRHAVRRVVAGRVPPRIQLHILAVAPQRSHPR